MSADNDNHTNVINLHRGGDDHSDHHDDNVVRDAFLAALKSIVGSDICEGLESYCIILSAKDKEFQVRYTPNTTDFELIGLLQVTLNLMCNDKITSGDSGDG